MHHALSDALPIGWTVSPFGPDGARAVDASLRASLIVTRADFDGVEWCHASAASPTITKSYELLVALHKTVFGDGFAYQCFVPESDHVNIHETALHLWGRADGLPVLPRFGLGGSI